MLAINNNDYALFEDVLSSLIKIANDPTNIKKLLESINYDEFIDNLVYMFDAIDNSDN